MHNWEMLPPTNYENNWCNSSMPIKTEPQDTYGSSDPNTASESNPTSPESVESSSPPPALFYPENGQENPNYSPEGLGEFKPLTPPNCGDVPILPNGANVTNIPNISNVPSVSNVSSAVQSSSGINQPHSSRASSSFVRPEVSNFSLNASVSPNHLPPNPSPLIDDTPPKSPKSSNGTPDKDDNSSNSCDDSHSIESDDDDIRLPKVNSHGKVKTFKCKQCDFVAVTKMSFWEHTKAHIKPEKMLKCPKCPFVTEYKHHLEYHLRNHDGSKPFQCNRCNYSCVNKSMLNSHLKSHSNIYQYRCTDCNYATKYCHSLKLHLRKYSHKPAMVLNQDGSPNPLPIIDVYGTRRGPKNRNGSKQSTSQQAKLALQQSQQNLMALQQQQQHPSQSNQQQNLNQQQQQQQLQNLLPPIIPNPFNMLHFPYLNLNLQILAAQQQVLAQISPPMGDQDDRDDGENDVENNDAEENDRDDGNGFDSDSEMQEQEQNNNFDDEIPPAVPVKKPVKMEDDDSCDEEPPRSNFVDNTINNAGSARNLCNTNDIYSLINPHSPTSSLPMDRPVVMSRIVRPAVERPERPPMDRPERPPMDRPERPRPVMERPERPVLESPVRPVMDRPEEQRAQYIYECRHCDMAFKDAVLHSIHMGYHGYNDVFKCNMCGEKCDDRVSFFLHIARNAHA